jgi:hypothetical protein
VGTRNNISLAPPVSRLDVPEDYGKGLESRREALSVVRLDLEAWRLGSSRHNGHSLILSLALDIERARLIDPLQDTTCFLLSLVSFSSRGLEWYCLLARR